MKAVLMRLKKSWRTVPWNLGVIFWGFMEMFMGGIFWSPSGLRAPASILQKVVLPVPFSPIMTRISDPVKVPGSTLRWKLPMVFSMAG